MRRRRNTDTHANRVAHLHARVGTAASPYPTTIVRYGFAQTATDFYVFGGVSDGLRVTNVNRYNLATGMWTSHCADAIYQ